MELAALSRSTRREHTRRRRTVQALGDRVGYRRTGTRTELLAAFDALDDLHQRRNALRIPTPHAPDLNLPWRDVLKECAGIAFIATLTLDARPVAPQLCLARGTRAYSLITAVDVAHRDLSPGHAQLHFLCDDLTEEGYTALDLGRTTGEDGQRSYKASHGATWTTPRTAPPRSATARPARRPPGHSCRLHVGPRRVDEACPRGPGVVHRQFPVCQRQDPESHVFRPPFLRVENRLMGEVLESLGFGGAPRRVVRQVPVADVVEQHVGTYDGVTAGVVYEAVQSGREEEPHPAMQFVERRVGSLGVGFTEVRGVLLGLGLHGLACAGPP
ncbi:GNAT family N-acetyltransferase [Streptomyces sp. NPDC051636]|uniref:GNAT family N-acetyltransferase n=1 Tax=Streptomyces sp. NPDC051636 TaxID=3365663 RepID=UPI00379BA6E2